MPVGLACATVRPRRELQISGSNRQSSFMAVSGPLARPEGPAASLAQQEHMAIAK